MNDSDHKQALPPGYEINAYRLIEVLGVGGFGVTYLADDATLARRVAIKEYLPNEFAMREGTAVHPKSRSDRDDFQWGLERFLDEARTLARFRHPNLVRVVEYFEANNTAYIVMDYEEGEPLSRLLDSHGTLTEAQLRRVLMPILDGLKQVHGAGYLHRDIKPSNIYVRRSDESPVLLDFGAARQALGRKSKSLTAVASAGYSPPEQYESEGEQGPWTDIYALSALCYRAIAGESPVEAPRRMNRLAQRQPDPQPRLSESGVPGYSASFLDAVDWGLDAVTSRRPLNLDDWVVRLASVSQTGASQRTSGNESVQAETRARRGRLWSVAVGAVLILVVGVLAVWTYIGGHSILVLGTDPAGEEVRVSDTGEMPIERTLPQDDNTESETPAHALTSDSGQGRPVPVGTLTVTTTPPDATVTIEGADDPYRPDLPLEHGRYQVTAAREGYISRTRTVSVSGATSVRIDLVARQAPFTVEPDPPDARIRILNIAPRYRAGMSLEGGTYQVEVSASGYRTSVESVRHGLTPTEHRVSLVAEPAPGVFRDCPVCPEMVPLPLASEGFTMGSNRELGRYPNEGPQRRVTFETSFAVGLYEVTFNEWDACVVDGGCREHRPLDQGWGRDRYPAINVSWHDAQAFVEWLTFKTGRPYRLPSEAEWEYAARANTKTARYWGDVQDKQCGHANGADVATAEVFSGFPTATCLDGVVHTVAVDDDRFKPNEWGLRHMLGNVWEWTACCWHESYAEAPPNGAAWSYDCETPPNGDDVADVRVLRGGSWISPPRELRAAMRRHQHVDARDGQTGFRVAVTLRH